MHVEQKVNGTWEHSSHPQTPRCYAVFAKMANVRNYGAVDPISQPRGLPSDISLPTRLDADQWDDDGHSYSYLTQSEIAELYEYVLENGTPTRFCGGFHDMFGYFYGDDFSTHDKARCPQGIEDVRFVFWFDN